MRVEAEFSNDGVLIAKLADRYRGRHVRVIIEDEDELAWSQWAALSEILDLAEAQAIRRLSHREILDEVRQFRESE